MSPRLLVVDDDPDVREIVAFQARLLGHEVTVAATLGATLALLGADPPTVDLVLTDLDLAGEDGREVVAACRTRGLPVVAMSAAEPDPPLDVPTLPKPVELGALSAALDGAFGG
jgi:two-component system OmpR family response regulator